AVGAELALDDNVAAGRKHVGLRLAGGDDAERNGIGRRDGLDGRTGIVDVGNRHDFKFEGEGVRVPGDVAGLDATGDADRLSAQHALARGHFGNGEVILGGGANRTEYKVADRENDQDAADEESWTYS